MYDVVVSLFGRVSGMQSHVVVETKFFLHKKAHACVTTKPGGRLFRFRLTVTYNFVNQAKKVTL